MLAALFSSCAISIRRVRRSGSPRRYRPRRVLGVSRFHLSIATDQENGIVRRTGSGISIFPGNMALGAIGSEAVTEAVAHATGEERTALERILP